VAVVARGVRLAARARAVEDEARRGVGVLFEIEEGAAREVFEEGVVLRRQTRPSLRHGRA
jgi:hypothetical protein